MVMVINRMMLIALILCSISRSLAQKPLEFTEETLKAATCPYKYTCKTSDQQFTAETCAFYDTITSTYYTRPCSSGFTCGIVAGKVEPYNYTCTATAPATKYALIGEYCKQDADCMSPYSIKCKNNACEAAYVAKASCLTTGATTPDHKWCPAGQYCQTTTTGQTTTGECVSLLKMGESCTADEQCPYNAGCNITAAQLAAGQTGLCVESLSLKSGEYIGTCPVEQLTPHGASTLCASITCAPAKEDGLFVCIDAVKSLTNTPQSCSNINTFDADSCLSTKDSATGNSMVSMCSCAYNKAGSSYCGLFPGDSKDYTFLKYLSKWFSSSGIKKCNTEARLDTLCQRSQWDSKNREAYLYYNTYSLNYALIQNAEDCSLSVFVPTYKAAEDSYNSSAALFAISALAFMAFV